MTLLEGEFLELLATRECCCYLLCSTIFSKPSHSAFNDQIVRLRDEALA